MPLSAIDAISGVRPDRNSMAVILITNVPNLCPQLGVQQRNWQFEILLFIPKVGEPGSFAPTAPGVFPVYTFGAPSGPQALVYFSVFDPDGPLAANDGGNVTLTRVDDNGYADNRYSGTLDVTFIEGSHVTGSFSTGACEFLDR